LAESYGTLAFSVSRRTKEVGIRMALGAERRTVLAMIVREGTAVVSVGALLGIGIAVIGTRLARHRLYVPPATDVCYWVSAATLVLLVGLLACFFPARRASRTEPLLALRDDC
jgi:putative ABC transport system permease protein